MLNVDEMMIRVGHSTVEWLAVTLEPTSAKAIRQMSFEHYFISRLFIPISIVHEENWNTGHSTVLWPPIK